MDPDGSERDVKRRSQARRFRMGRSLVALAAIPWAVGPAGAEDVTPTPEQITERTSGFLAIWDALRAGESGLRVRVEPALVSSGKYEGSRLWWYRVGGSIEAGLPVNDRLSLGISPSFAFEQLLLKGSDAFLITAGGRDTTISDFFDGSLSVGGKLRLTEQWGSEFVLSGSARQEAGASFDDSVQFGGSVAATYRRGAWLRLRLGVGLGADLDDGQVRVSPVYRIVLKPHPDVTLESSGLRGSASYDFSRRVAVTLSGGTDGTQYNLEKRSAPPAGLGGGTLQRRQSLMTLGVSYRWTKGLRVAAEAGLVFRQELAVLNSEGAVVDERKDRTASANARLRFEFRL